jgi:hypothetical protein
LDVYYVLEIKLTMRAVAQIPHWNSITWINWSSVWDRLLCFTHVNQAHIKDAYQDI